MLKPDKNISNRVIIFIDGPKPSKEDIAAKEAIPGSVFRNAQAVQSDDKPEPHGAVLALGETKIPAAYSKSKVITPKTAEFKQQQSQTPVVPVQHVVPVVPAATGSTPAAATPVVATTPSGTPPPAAPKL